ncbi:hypothetical protein B9T11_07925 [Wohlfahrtiimonas chitiniclastica]|uniref:hypothetical protein n=1 Tax=Wohlfahrtiimonas chitiniclastica TaxID=400946 RepID=UPI000B997720|nr:hypothetical protein [Wohlfahrtiimonas chitiniclastica]MBS7818671.1 hypothetical protein [Wohlfahrtiimonas chitiniclastica]OYQ79155.1 hypothetical protein B9T11_07925 [Wohlfahrtiimonas chitiniclastica]
MFSKIHWRYIVAGMVSGLVVVGTAYLFYLAATDCDSLQEYGLYKFIKDHGSLIGAVVAILGVAWVIKVQRETTISLIENERYILEKQIFEESKRIALRNCIEIQFHFSELIKGINLPCKTFDGKNDRTTSTFNSLLSSISVLREFMLENNYGGLPLIDLIDEYLSMYELIENIDNRKKYNVHSGVPISFSNDIFVISTSAILKIRILESLKEIDIIFGEKLFVPVDENIYPYPSKIEEFKQLEIDSIDMFITTTLFLKVIGIQYLLRIINKKSIEN